MQRYPDGWPRSLRKTCSSCSILVMLERSTSRRRRISRKRSDIFVLTGSSSVEEALDSYNDENGVLAHVVKQGLLGQAASPDGQIDALQLGVYARRAVPKLAAERNHKQSAVFKAAGGDLKEFPIASVGSEN